MDPTARVIVVSADVQTSSHELVAQAAPPGSSIKPVDANEVLTLVRSTLGEKADGTEHRSARRAGRAAEHRLRPRRRVALEADQQRVLLEVPQVAIHPIDAARTQSLGKLVDDASPACTRCSRGPVAGDALLLLDPIAAATLKELLTDEPPLPLELDRVVARSVHRSRQHPAERLHRHVRQHARSADVVLGARTSTSASVHTSSTAWSRPAMRCATPWW